MVLVLASGLVRGGGDGMWFVYGDGVDPCGLHWSCFITIKLCCKPAVNSMLCKRTNNSLFYSLSEQNFSCCVSFQGCK